LTNDGAVAFSQAVAAGPLGAFLLTLESYAAGDHIGLFRSVVSTIKTKADQHAS
jgi:hypothetical protein